MTTKATFYFGSLLVLILASCSRENSILTEDVVPVFEAETIFVADTLSFAIDTVIFDADSTDLTSRLQIDGQGDFVENLGYWMQFSSYIVASDGSFVDELLFAFEWDPLTSDEEFIQEATYFPTTARGKSPADIESILQWIDEGSDPATYPNTGFNNYQYDASGIQINVSNIELDIFPPTTFFGNLRHFDTATVNVLGVLTDNSGNSIPINAVVTPTWAFTRIYDEW